MVKNLRDVMKTGVAQSALASMHDHSSMAH